MRLRCHKSVLLALGLMGAVASRASPARAEPLLVSLEGAGVLAMSTPQTDRFGPGAAFALGAMYPIAPAFLLGVRMRGAFLSNGPAPTDPALADPETGTLESVSLTLRFRPFAGSAGIRRATGLFLDAAGGGGMTGDLTRGAFEAGAGYGFGAGPLSIAPTLRYVQVTQPEQHLAGADARLIMLGAEVTLFDARPASTAPKALATQDAPPDRDKDGIADAKDKCVEQPEDFDTHQDEDGCPDPDNDGDGLADVKDKCPDHVEDVDQFKDDDGCPEPDNDTDGFLDADDQCPNEAEVVNGNKDFDGCPDEGLIEFKDNRIVLEERVLFDSERARVKREARPILRAIVNLKAQHPDWISVRIEGHADARGDAKFNQELSEHRANNVMKELVKLGIPPAQIEFVGYGSTRLRDRREEEEAHARNRRVEFVVTARGVAKPEDLQKAPPPSAAPDSDEEEETDEPTAPAPPPAKASESKQP